MNQQENDKAEVMLQMIKVEYGAMREEIQMNGTLDILKLIMSILIVGIHTEPFGFNIWLDRGYGMITRLCVLFFFVSSAYFYWSREKGAKVFLKRLLMLYIA